MPLPICIEIPEIPDPFSLTLPGGVSIEHINLMEVIQPALTPLVPVFNIIDTVVAVFNCIKAIPDSLGPPPDPTALAACLPDLAEKVDKLLKLIPQLSLPLRDQCQEPLRGWTTPLSHPCTSRSGLWTCRE